MPLFIKDDAVDELAKKYMALSNATTKSEAVKQALLQALERHESAPTAIEIARKYREALRANAGPNQLLADKPFRDSCYEGK